MKKKPAETLPKKQPRSRMPKKAFMWATAGFLVSLWMFVLGLLVGRGTAPVKFDINKLQNELAGLKKATIEKTTQRYKVAFEELDKKIDLGFHEALTDKKLNIQAPAEPAPANSGKPAEKKASTNTHIRHKVKEDTFKKRKTAKNKKPPQPGMVIQVVATKDENHANKLVAKLKSLGYNAYRTTGTIPDRGTWHRVRIGGFKNTDEAKTAMNELKNKQFSPIFIRQ